MPRPLTRCDPLLSTAPALVAFARAKLGRLSDSDIAAIEAISDQRTLTELVTLLGQARSARKTRATLNRVLGH